MKLTRHALFGSLSAFVFVLVMGMATVSASPTLPDNLRLSDEVRVVVWYDLPGPDTYVGAVSVDGGEVTHHFILDDVCWLELLVELDAINTFQRYPVEDYDGGEAPYAEAVAGFERIILR